ncbi:MAG TPA: hypothetical protein DCQ06_11980 [Myxococcales bacterium]|nr:hypothetical protein [Myxococcales bacterium]
MKTTLRLVYWDFPFWRAEVCRLALHLGGIEFEDVRPNRQQSQQMKRDHELPFGQLPVLYVGDEVIAQTGAIARYCGRLAGLYPHDDPLKAARVDAVIDAATDITWLIRPSIREPDPAKKLAMRAQIVETSLPTWLGHLQRWLECHGDQGFVVGESLTIGDLALWRLVGWLRSGVLDGIPENIGEHLPLLMAHQHKIGSIEPIAAWMHEHYGA